MSHPEIASRRSTNIGIDSKDHRENLSKEKHTKRRYLGRPQYLLGAFLTKVRLPPHTSQPRFNMSPEVLPDLLYAHISL